MPQLACNTWLQDVFKKCSSGKETAFVGKENVKNIHLNLLLLGGKFKAAGGFCIFKVNKPGIQADGRL